MLGPENELEATVPASVSLPLSTGVFQLDDLPGLALAKPVDGEGDGVADADVVPRVAVGSDEFDAAPVAWGATVTNRVTAGCGGT
ncbi:hypothetical protein [Paenarthrobacter sp. TA1.8]|uniref:hypothetical protein n=1 Tax=Paenarthrobacter sp. TA1.8 TaxID=3400219 RepID=UPI003B42DF30